MYFVSEILTISKKEENNREKNMKGAYMDNKTHENALKKVYGKSRNTFLLVKMVLKRFSKSVKSIEKPFNITVRSLKVLFYCNGVSLIL